MEIMKKDDIKERVRRAVQTMPSRENVEKIFLFGSHLHGTPRKDSDVDLLIELTGPVGYFELVGMERFLSESLGAPVDLVTRGALSKYFRDEVIREAEPLYEK